MRELARFHSTDVREAVEANMPDDNSDRHVQFSTKLYNDFKSDTTVSTRFAPPFHFPVKFQSVRLSHTIILSILFLKFFDIL